MMIQFFTSMDISKEIVNCILFYSLQTRLDYHLLFSFQTFLSFYQYNEAQGHMPS